MTLTPFSTPETSDVVDAMRPKRYAWLRRLAVIVGLALIAAALGLLWWERDAVVAALDAIRSPHPAHLVLLALGVVANVALTALMFNVLMTRYGRVGLLEMQAVIAGTMLLNYLPMRPGLFGRIAYHKAVNRILARHSAMTIVQASVLSALITGYLACVAFTSIGIDVSLWYGMIAPVPVLGAMALVQRWRIWALAGFVRYLEVLVWAMRYFVSFALIDHPIGLTGALAFACISMMATMLPFVSNGLGLREWGIGLTAPLLTPHQLEFGITAELVNRAGELIVIVVLGLIGIGWLTHRRKHYAAQAQIAGNGITPDDPPVDTDAPTDASSQQCASPASGA